MNPILRRAGALGASAAFVLAIAGTALAATPAKLTALVAEDSTARPDQGKAWVRVLHGSPDAPAVDIWVDSEKAVTALAFKSITQIGRAHV